MDQQNEGRVEQVRVNKLVKQIRNLIIASAVKAVVWAIGVIVIWAIITAYSIDSKVESRYNELKGLIINSQNEAVLREAQTREEISALRNEIDILKRSKKIELPPALPGAPAPGPAFPMQAPIPNQDILESLHYIERNIKKH